jgi:WD40 repeat protein
MIQVYNSNYNLTLSFRAHSNQINRIKLLPNGYVATCSNENVVKIWNPSNNYWNFIHTGGYNTVALEYINSNTIASGGLDGYIHIWSINSGLGRRITTYSPVFSLQLMSSNSNRLIAGLYQVIHIYDITTDYPLSGLFGHTNFITDIVLINSNLLASGSHDYTVRIWNLTTNQSVYVFSHAWPVTSLKMISSDTLASGSLDRTVKLWNITSGSLIRTFTGHSAAILLSVDLFSPQILVSGSEDQTIKLWNISSGQVQNTINTGVYVISLAVVSPIQGKEMFFYLLKLISE